MVEREEQETANRKQETGNRKQKNRKQKSREQRSEQQVKRLPGDVGDDVEPDEGGEGQGDYDGDDIDVEGELGVCGGFERGDAGLGSWLHGSS